MDIVINDELLARLSNLAKLDFDDAEKSSIKKDLANILDFIAQIDTLDTANEEPLVYLNDEVTVLRPDKVRHLLNRADALKNAPMQDGDYFLVPKVIKK